MRFMEVDIYNGSHVKILYELLSRREDHQNISHKEMPSYKDHERFVRSNPYWFWAFIRVDVMHDFVIGTIYLTNNNEIGIHILDEYTGKGYGEQAIKMLIEKATEILHGPFYANINPNNEGSIRFFERLGFKHIQNTYRLDDGK